ncbi:MAG: hypothetical protein M1835_000690 [Candelina submexicana]|nr:MAG: hypothetical protein M1835_000690 [Candelina submexicana]
MATQPAARNHILYHNAIRASPRRSRFNSTPKLFHTTPRYQWIEPTLTATHTLLESLHNSTNLSWALTLPCSALCVRLVIILPISLYTRHVQQQQLRLQPLVHAWKHQISRTVLREAGHLGPAYCTTEIRRHLRAKRKELYRRYACGWWKNWLPLGQLPVFLVLIETVRAMCGTGKGLLAMAADSLAGGRDTDALDKVGHTAGGTFGASIPVESTFATEGALWFPDLLVPDPHLLLPFILSGTMFTNIWLNTRLQNDGTEPSVFQRRLTNSLNYAANAERHASVLDIELIFRNATEYLTGLDRTARQAGEALQTQDH